MYKWDGKQYITDDTPEKTKIINKEKLGDSFRLVSSRDVVEVDKNPNGTTEYKGKLLIFNNIFYSWNEKIDEPKAEYIGMYKEYTELIDSDTIPVSKVKNIIESFLIS